MAMSVDQMFFKFALLGAYEPHTPAFIVNACAAFSKLDACLKTKTDRSTCVLVKFAY